MFSANLFFSRSARCHRTCAAAGVISSKISFRENDIMNARTVITKTEMTATNSQTYQKFSNQINVYRNLFPWRNELELAKFLAQNIVYLDRSLGLVAISKPYGLPIYPSAVAGNSKTNQNTLRSSVYGESRFCLSDTLDYLAQLLNFPKLIIVKSPQREWSGVVLLASTDAAKPAVSKAIRRAKASTTPHIRLLCITAGVMPETGAERCGIRLIELDEFGTHKEPVYIAPQNMSERLRKASSIGNSASLPESAQRVKCATVHYRTLATNRDLAVSFVELRTSLTRWNFAQCFLAYKAAFVLGDAQFSRRVRHILGQPISLPPRKVMSLDEIRRNDQSAAEPLAKSVRDALRIRSNDTLPLMVHCAGLTLPKFLPKSRSVRGKVVRKSAEASNTSADPDDEDDKVDDNSQQFPTNDSSDEPQLPQLVKAKKDTTSDRDLIIGGEGAEDFRFLPPHFVYTLDRLDLNVFRVKS